MNQQQEKSNRASLGLPRAEEGATRRATFKVMFFIQKTKCKADGTAPILTRLTVNQEMIHFSTKVFVHPDRWDSQNYRTLGLTKEEKTINFMLDELKASIQRRFFDLQAAGEVITASKIKMQLFSTNEKENMTLVKLFKIFIDEYEKLVLTQDYGHESFFRYKLCRNRVLEFLGKEYKTNDYALTDINRRFLDKLYLYLRTERGLNNNTAVKFMHRFSSVFKKARDNGWVNGDPFKLQKLHLDKVDRGYLTTKEIETMYTKEFATPRLEAVRDIFIFCCYTGLPYIDARDLTYDHIREWSDGKQWISIKRQKTKVPVNVRLLSIPLTIIEKYRGQNGNKVLPVPTNQKCNDYLKEIGEVCGFQKELTFHRPRHRNLFFSLKNSKLQEVFPLQVTI